MERHWVPDPFTHWGKYMKQLYLIAAFKALFSSETLGVNTGSWASQANTLSLSFSSSALYFVRVFLCSPGWPGTYNPTPSSGITGVTTIPVQEFFFFFERISPCISVWPGTHYVDQADLQFRDIYTCLCFLSAGVEGECLVGDEFYIFIYPSF